MMTHVLLLFFFRRSSWLEWRWRKTSLVMKHRMEARMVPASHSSPDQSFGNRESDYDCFSVSDSFQEQRQRDAPSWMPERIRRKIWLINFHF